MADLSRDLTGRRSFSVLVNCVWPAPRLASTDTWPGNNGLREGGAFSATTLLLQSGRTAEEVRRPLALVLLEKAGAMLTMNGSASDWMAQIATDPYRQFATEVSAPQSAEHTLVQSL